MTLKNRKGQDLIQLALYAAALVILLAVAIPRYDNYIPTVKNRSDYAQIADIATKISQYKYEVGTYPINLQALTATNGSYGPWLRRLPSQDAWGTTNTGINGSAGGVSPYCYAYDNNGFAVWSLGQNKVNNSGGGGTAVPASFSGDDYGVISK